MADPIRVLLVDDQRLMREGLRILLELEPDLEIAGEATHGQEALDTYAEIEPDVVLMDVRMPGMDGVEATWRLRERWPGARSGRRRAPCDSRSGSCPPARRR